MSRAKAKDKRIKADAYMTPPDLAMAITERVWASNSYLGTWEVVEPSAGRGAFVAAARRVLDRTVILAVDSNARYKPACKAAGADGFVHGKWQEVAPRWAAARTADHALVIGNPPYSQAAQHVAATLANLRDGDVLAYLLRINFLGSKKRLGFWRDHPATRIIPIVPRPSFHGGGSDATEYAVFMWQPGLCETKTIVEPPIVWSKPRRRAA